MDLEEIAKEVLKKLPQSAAYKPIRQEIKYLLKEFFKKPWVDKPREDTLFILFETVARVSYDIGWNEGHEYEPNEYEI